MWFHLAPNIVLGLVIDNLRIPKRLRDACGQLFVLFALVTILKTSPQPSTLTALTDRLPT